MGSAKELLETMLRGATPPTSMIVELLKDEAPESELHDYKRGEWLEDGNGPATPGKPSRASARLRKWIAGFANSDGGVLVVGVADGTLKNGKRPPDAWSVGGCPRPGKPGKAATRDLLTGWATTSLAELKRFDVLPRIRVLEIAGKLVLLVAVGAADQYVWCREGNDDLLYLRFGDSTRAATRPLIADLTQGRRSRPRLDVSAVSTVINDMGQARASHTMRLRIENAGLVWIPEVRLLVVAHVSPHQITRREEGWSHVPDTVLHRVRATREVLGKARGAATLAVKALRFQGGLAPMEHREVGFTYDTPAFFESSGAQAVSMMGVVCLLSNGLPVYAQGILRWSETDAYTHSELGMTTGGPVVLFGGSTEPRLNALLQP